MSLSLFGQTDYRAWLRSIYEERKARNKGFSYRFLSERLGMDHSLLVRILRGERHLSERGTDSFVTWLKLSQREEEYFRSMVKFGRARGARERLSALDRLMSLQRTTNRGLGGSHAEYFRDVRLPALRGVIGLGGFRDPSKAGERLDPPVDAEEAVRLVGTLHKLGLVNRRPDGQWELTESFVEASADAPVLAIREHQRQMLGLAIASLDRHAPELRQISTATLGMAASDLPEARERIRALRDSLLQLARDAHTPDMVFQFQASLFPLTRHMGSQGRSRA